MSEIIKYMFDTNIFNDIIDNRINISSFKDNIVCCVTHLQKKEINNTSNPDRRKKLIELFEVIQDEDYVTETFLMDVSLMEHDKLGDGKLYKKIYERLNNLQKRNNNHIDALIGETALKNDITLVTHDHWLYRVMTESKCPVSNVYQVLKTHK